jgi:type IX secretion system PorP/SprF family membrane protein
MKKLKYFLIITILWISTATYAQLNPMGSLYFQNPYQANPALAGIEKGWEVNVASKIQWTAIEAAPTMQSATATFGTNGQKIGFGLNVYNENAGVFLRTAVKGTYAYHIPLNDDCSFLDFGLSAGVTSEWIDYEKVIGDLNDPTLKLFNGRKSYVDGDFGIAYRNQRLTAEVSIPNLKRFLNRDIIRNTIDRSLYMAALGYRFSRANFTIDSKAMYRRIENYKDIIDLGAQLQCFEDKLTMSMIYHSTNSLTFGIGTFYQKKLKILCLYTTGTSDLAKYSNGEFEIALQYRLK